MRDEGGHGTGSLLLSFLLGGMAGAAVALLFAPQSGRETRRKIAELAENAKDTAECYVDEAKHKAKSTISKGREYVEEKRNIVSTAIEAGKEAYEKEKEKHSKSA